MDAVASLLDETVVDVRGLSVRFGAKVALEGVSLRVPRGRVMAVVGANGAGKSTLLRALLGLVPIERGDVRVFGRPGALLGPRDRRRFAYVSERHAELGHASVGETVRLRRSFYPTFDVPLFRALTGDLGIPDSSRVETLSRGQRAIVAVALALAQRPDLLLLDDPTLGLDPLARRSVIQSLIATMRERELTVLFTSHELDDVERVADDVLLLARGRGSVAVETDEFVADACACLVPGDLSPSAIATLPAVLWVWPRRNGQEVVLRGAPEARAATLAALSDLAGGAVAAAPITFEALALAWLAADRRAS